MYRVFSVDDCYDKDYFKSDGRLLPKDQCLRAVRRAKVKINVATDWRCEPFSGKAYRNSRLKS